MNELTPSTLPNVVREEKETCLIVKNPKADAKKFLKLYGHDSIQKVLDITALKDKYRSFESRRKLRDSYDVFLCDERVLPQLPALLGKTFFDVKKFPIPVELKSTTFNNHVEKALTALHMYIPSGDSM